MICISGVVEFGDGGVVRVVRVEIEVERDVVVGCEREVNEESVGV